MQDIHDIKPVISLEYISRGTVMAIVFVICILAISLISWLIYRYAKKKLEKDKTLDVVREQKTDYQEIARQRFEKAREKIGQGQFKEFHLEAALIIREYLSGQFGIEAVDMTSREILDRPQLDSDIKKELKDFFEMNDYSKFAGEKEEGRMAREVLEIGIKIIDFD